MTIEQIENRLELEAHKYTLAANTYEESVLKTNCRTAADELNTALAIVRLTGDIMKGLRACEPTATLTPEQIAEIEARYDYKDKPQAMNSMQVRDDIHALLTDREELIKQVRQKFAEVVSSEDGYYHFCEGCQKEVYKGNHYCHTCGATLDWMSA